MRLLFTSSPGVGHLLPILPVAAAARAAGHEVVVGCGDSVASVARRAGVRQVTLGPATIDEVRVGIPGFAEADGPARAVLMFREAFARRIAEAMVEDVAAFAERWRPDVIVHEDLEMGSWIVAELLGIPHVTIQATAWRPDQRAGVIATQNELRVRRGLTPDPELSGRDGAIFFTTRPPSLRDPGEPFPDGTQELRPGHDDRVGGETDELPVWLASPAPVRPRIAVTLGTVNAHRVDLFRPIIDGLAELDVEVVVGLGADPETLGPVPGNVRVSQYIPMSLLLPHSAVVIHHGGSGTTLAGLAAGTPMATVPITADQPKNAAQAVQAGVSVTLDATRLDAGDVRVAVERLLTEPSFAERARAVAAEVAAMPDSEAAVSAIEELV